MVIRRTYHRLADISCLVFVRKIMIQIFQKGGCEIQALRLDAGSKIAFDLQGSQVFVSRADDPYAVFQRKLERGYAPDDWAALNAASKSARDSGIGSPARSR